jgi:hypothetical protein
MRMRHIILSFVAYLAHYLISGTIFGKSGCTTTNLTGVQVKYPLLLSGFNETLILLDKFLKIRKYQISRKFVQSQPNRSMRTCRRTKTQIDRQTDRLADITKLTVALHNFANAPKTHQGDRTVLSVKPGATHTNHCDRGSE